MRRRTQGLPLGTGATASAAGPADLARRAAASGSSPPAAAVALAAGRAITGTGVGAACFTGAWAASVFGKAGAGELGSWPTDADEALDLISRTGRRLAELVCRGFRRSSAARLLTDLRLTLSAPAAPA